MSNFFSQFYAFIKECYVDFSSNLHRNFSSLMKINNFEQINAIMSINQS